MTAYSPRDVAFSKILYVVPPDDGDAVNDGTLSGGGSLDGTNTEGEGGVLTIAYTDNTDNATAAGSRVAGTYTVSPTGGDGSGLVLSIEVNADRSLEAAVVVNGGKDYAAANVVTVAGTELGGTAPAGNATLSPNAPLATAANSTGVSSSKRHFIPVNAGLTRTALTNAADDSDANPSARRGDGIDYGNEAQNLAAQREQCEKIIGQNRDSIDAGDTADEQLGITVFGNI